MATITGARGTSNILADQRRIDMSADIDLLEPDAAPLALLSKRAGKAATGNSTFNWLEDTLKPRFSATSGTATTTATTVNVTSGQGSYFEQHDLVRNTRTGEIFRVVSVATDALTVVRNANGDLTTGVAMNSADELLILGSAQPEGDTSRAARSNNPTKATNYTQIFRLPWELTETLRASEQVTTTSDWANQARKKGIDHAKDIEYAFLFGKSFEDTSGSQPRRGTAGALSYISTNTLDAGGTLSEAEWNQILRTGFRYGSRNKVVLASALVGSVLNQFAVGRLQVRQGDNTYGLAVTDYISPFGRVNVVTHWLLEGSVYSGYAIGLDMDEVKYRYLANGDSNRDTHIRTNIQAPDSDTRKDEYLSEVGLQFGQEKRHFLLTGVTG